MTDLVYIPDYASMAQGLLLSQYNESPRVQALIAACAGGFQAIEDTGFDLLVSTTLSAATGWALDQWGVVVGEPRRGLDDGNYRRFIEARILANLSEGTTDDLIRVFGIIAGPGEVEHWALYPAGFGLSIQRTEPLSDEMRDRIRAFMEEIRPAGVDMTLIEAPLDAFQYDAGPGFDEGQFARIL